MSNHDGRDDNDKAVHGQLSIKLTEANLPVCSLRPHPKCPLFVAWNGVLVLVYEAFPSSFLKAKKIMEESVINQLQPENFGSKWPKTTLAAVIDTAPDLTLEELTRLKEICDEYSQKILEMAVAEESNFNNQPTATSTTIGIPAISLVQYECRSLEKLRSRVDVSLLEHQNVLLEEDDASERQKEIVQAVVGEWATSLLPSYLPKVNAPGSRMSSYRTTYQGATCVAFVDSVLPDPLRQLLIEFRWAVDLEFPGRYAWMAEKSLHCTLRSLDTVDDRAY